MTTKINTDEQAFPFMERVWCTETDQYVLGESTLGMTLRDYFAAKAMQGMMADHTRDSYPLDLAKHGYAIADAMLEARK